MRPRPASYAMSPGHAPAQGASQWRPVATPKTENSWFWLATGMSESHTLPVYPTPQARLRPVGGQERMTSLGAVGDHPAGVPLMYRCSVVVALGSKPLFFSPPDTLPPSGTGRAAPLPPVSWISHVMSRLPVFRSVSVLVRVWF